MTHHPDPYAPQPGAAVPAAPAPMSGPHHASGPHYAYGEPLYTVPPVTVHAGLGTASVVLAVAWTVVQLVQTLLAPLAADAYADAASFGLSPIESAFTAYDGVGVLTIPVLLAAFVVSALWLYRSRVSAQGANPHFVHERGKVWAWLGWVVPLVSLWFPYQVVRDVRRATCPRPVGEIGWWWAAWLVGLLTGDLADRISSRTSPELSEVAAAGVVPLEVVSSLGTVVALVLWVRIVREVTAWQRERLGAVGAA